MKNFLHTIVNRIAIARKADFEAFDLPAFKQRLSRTHTTLTDKPMLLYQKVIMEFFLIAECKKASPAKGLLQENYYPAEIARGYEAGGASAISVLTEPDFFQGSPLHLEEVVKTVMLPVLWKDFIIHEQQIAHAYHSGASFILLILRITDTEKLYHFIDLSLAAGLLPLVEMFIDDDFNRVVELCKRYPEKFLLGINNRDLATFKVDLRHTETVFKKITAHNLNLPLISESGISTAEEILHLKTIGCAGALVGESIVKTPTPKAASQAVENLLHRIK